MAGEWYYAKNGQQLGPVSAEVLTRLAASGQVQPTDLVWSEGMPNWAPARTVRAIFPEAPPVPVAPAPVAQEAGGYALSAEPVEEAAPAPRRVRERVYDEPEEDEWDRPRPRRRRGVHPAVLIGGITAGVVVVIGLVVLLVVLLKPGNPRTFSIQAGEKKTFHIEFKAGQKAEIWINSENNTDIDIFVFDDANFKVAEDIRFDKNCYVWFIPQRTQTYRIDVVNVNRGGRLPVGNNRCTMKWSPP
jgi:hypothetical protein